MEFRCCITSTTLLVFTLLNYSFHTTTYHSDSPAYKIHIPPYRKVKKSKDFKEKVID